jgi:hypothetical protein
MELKTNGVHDIVALLGDGTQLPTARFPLHVVTTKFTVTDCVPVLVAVNVVLLDVFTFTVALPPPSCESETLKLREGTSEAFEARGDENWVACSGRAVPSAKSDRAASVKRAGGRI